MENFSVDALRKTWDDFRRTLKADGLIEAIKGLQGHHTQPLKLGGAPVPTGENGIVWLP